MMLLGIVVNTVKEKGWRIGNIDATVIARRQS